MENPNKIFVLEYKGKNLFESQSHFVIVIAASSIEVAKQYTKETINIDVEPTWLMNAVHPTIWETDGKKPKTVQAKILYNGYFHS